MKNNHLLKILSSLIVKFSDAQAENFYFQVKFINCYLREIISFIKKIDIRGRDQSTFSFDCKDIMALPLCCTMSVHSSLNW